MPRVNPRANCKDCGGHRSEVGEMSYRGLCPECGIRREREALTQLSEHRGPIFEHWRRQSVAAFGAVFPDDLQKVS